MAPQRSALIGLLLLGLLSSELAWAIAAPSPAPGPAPRPARAPARPPAQKAPAPFVSQGLNFHSAAAVGPYTWPGLILVSTLVAALAPRIFQ